MKEEKKVKKENKFISEFKKFIMRGNVIDLAVGVIVGAAFGKIVSSLVDDILMPFIGMIIGGLNFSSLNIVIGESVIRYGSFLQNIIDFLIIAFCIFIFVKSMNKLFHKEEIKLKKDVKSKEEVLLEEIRDLLKKKK